MRLFNIYIHFGILNNFLNQNLYDPEKLNDLKKKMLDLIREQVTRGAKLVSTNFFLIQ